MFPDIVRWLLGRRILIQALRHPPTPPPLLSLCLEHRTTGLRYGSLDIPLGLRQGELLFSGAGRKPGLFLVFPP